MVGQAVIPGNFKRRYKRSPYDPGVLFYWLTVLTCIHSNRLVMSWRKVVYRRFFQFWLIFPNRTYKSRSIEHNFNWYCHHTLHLKKITFPIFECLLKPSGTTTKVLSCWRYRWLACVFSEHRPQVPDLVWSLILLKKILYSLCRRVLLQFLFSVMKGWKIT